MGRCLCHLSLQLPSSASHMGEVAHSEVSSMSNVRDSGGTHRESQFSRLSPTAGGARTPSLSGHRSSGCHCPLVSCPCPLVIKMGSENPDSLPSLLEELSLLPTLTHSQLPRFKEALRLPC